MNRIRVISILLLHIVMGKYIERKKADRKEVNGGKSLCKQQGNKINFIVALLGIILKILWGTRDWF